jgi:hypothetical protein
VGLVGSGAVSETHLYFCANFDRSLSRLEEVSQLELPTLRAVQVPDMMPDLSDYLVELLQHCYCDLFDLVNLFDDALHSLWFDSFIYCSLQ